MSWKHETKPPAFLPQARIDKKNEADNNRTLQALKHEYHEIVSVFRKSNTIMFVPQRFVVVVVVIFKKKGANEGSSEFEGFTTTKRSLLPNFITPCQSL